MILGNKPMANNAISIVRTEFDPYSSVQSMGYASLTRAKRDGRNPATGARTSKKFGLSNKFSTGFEPLVTGQNEVIY